MKQDNQFFDPESIKTATPEEIMAAELHGQYIGAQAEGVEIEAYELNGSIYVVDVRVAP